MEAYFIVKNEALIKQLKKYEMMVDKINNTFIEFSKAYDIETHKYYQATDRLRIIPTVKDSKKFKDQLKTDCETFKKNSSINKAWVELCEIKELETPYKPTYELAELISNYIYKFRCRLFSLGDDVYGSFEADICFNLSTEDFIELKASEFYKAIEEYNEKNKV